MAQEKNDSAKLRRGFTKNHLQGKHFFTLAKDLNEPFLRECEKERRGPADLIRIILEDRYANAVGHVKSIEIRPHGGERVVQKRNIA